MLFSKKIHSTRILAKCSPLSELFWKAIMHSKPVVLKLFWLKYPFKKKIKPSSPLTTQQHFALKYSEIIGSPEAGETM